MSLDLYDKALAKKLKNICEKSNIHVYDVQDTRRLFEVIADETKDKPIKLPIICLRRNDGYQIKEIGNNPRSANGWKLYNNEQKVGTLNQIPIQIEYQIDIYARKFEEADVIMRELVFILTNTPNVTITIPYHGIDFQHTSALSLSNQIRDNSSIAERLITGQFSRLTVDCHIPDAYLFDVREENIIGLNILDFGLDIYSPNDEIVHESLPLAIDIE